MILGILKIYYRTALMSKYFQGNIVFIQVLLYGEAEEALKKKENVVFMCNHQSTGL